MQGRQKPTRAHSVSLVVVMEPRWEEPDPKPLVKQDAINGPGRTKGKAHRHLFVYPMPITLAPTRYQIEHRAYNLGGTTAKQADEVTVGLET